MPDNIPVTAVKITYDYGEVKGSFYVWKTERGKYQWSALGNTDEADTQELAISAARSWIRYDTIK